eukprot:evm.model.scf_26.2 EVM.evm.TU.scf_26.2   scf_26:23724-25272(+)
MDALGELSGSDSSEDEGSPEPEAKRKKPDVTLEDLHNCGYKGGPSVLFVPEPCQADEIELQVSDGREHKLKESEEETWEERERTRAAATVGVAESAKFVKKRMALTEKLREEKKAEQIKMAKEGRLTFKQKEKRKRDAGQAKGGKNFVEEEKRVARDFGVYSNFDN